MHWYVCMYLGKCTCSTIQITSLMLELRWMIPTCNYFVLCLTTFPGKRIFKPCSKFMGQYWAHLGPICSRWARCWPHEPYYQGGLFKGTENMIFIFYYKSSPSVIIGYSSCKPYWWIAGQKELVPPDVSNQITSAIENPSFTHHFNGGRLSMSTSVDARDQYFRLISNPPVWQDTKLTYQWVCKKVILLTNCILMMSNITLMYSLDSPTLEGRVCIHIVSPEPSDIRELCQY